MSHTSRVHEVFAYLRVADTAAAIDFYTRAFGGEELFRLVEPSGRIGHAEVRFGPPNALAAIADGAPPTVPRCADQSLNSMCPLSRLEVLFDPDARETYQDRDAVTGALAPRTERITTGFVVDRGTLGGGFRTDSSADPMSAMENTFRAPAEPGPVTLFVYASDGRGGPPPPPVGGDGRGGPPPPPVGGDGRGGPPPPKP